MREVIADLREKGTPDEKLRKLSEEVARLSAETSRLRERLEGLEKTAQATPVAPQPEKKVRGSSQR